ncbi:dTDP-4-dehydrorhamnose reductase [Ilumatobacter nonamiensis]|uniref:dTDP-4-dehydrorhamnose reductase n=1 Tax=Ilumatobacter nonamiensis TaxID=467093 RepID=UPI0003498849|nr:dTDP-4-dehydrorhamnose reductase [Ilumatobacter nonamiensis]
MKFLVTGAAGQLGTDVVAHLADTDHEVDGRDRAMLDISDATAVDRALAATKPDVVINGAAFTAVDRCENEVDVATAINEHGVRHLARACARHETHLIHISTDYVFDGTLDRPYREDDTTNPQSVYGRTKLAGERAAFDELGDDATVVRTSWVCGEHGNNMVKLVIRLAAGDTPLAFVDDQRGCPTFTADLAPSLVALAEQRPGGVVHLTNSGAVSWYEFVRATLTASGHDPDRVRPISTAELDPPRPAPRPANSVLDDVRWRALGHRPMRDFREPLSELVERL